jgi:hypothetical protein
VNKFIVKGSGVIFRPPVAAKASFPPVEVAAMLCRHCQGARVSRPRGLCWTCFYTPSIRNRYRPQSRRGLGLKPRGARPLPDSPTGALPGSAEKVLVLAARARRGQTLWHPEDARLSLLGEEVAAPAAVG